MIESMASADNFGASLGLGAGVIDRAGPAGRYKVTAYRKSWRGTARLWLHALGLPALGDWLARGVIKWETTIENLVTTAGLNYLIGCALASTTQITAWSLGLTSTSPTVSAGDTAASHGGWTEVTAYSQGTRVTWTPGSVSGGSVDNSGSVANFSINANGTAIGGAFLISNNTKSGTTGTLYAAGAFTGGNKTLGSGDTLAVTATYSVS